MKYFLITALIVLGFGTVVMLQNRETGLKHPAHPALFSENSAFTVYSERILVPPVNTVLMELFPVDHDFLIGTWNNNNPSPIYFLRSLGNGIFQEYSHHFSEPINAVHPRHAIALDVNGDQKNDFLIADHGKDAPPFAGGFLQVIESEKNKWRSRKLPGLTDRAFFTYHLSATNHGKRSFLYQSNHSGPRKDGSILWEIKDGEFKDTSNLLPPILRSGNECFMSSEMSDLDNDGIEELIVGACDTQTNAASNRSDRIFRFNETEGYTPLPESTLAPRKKNPHWGTAFFLIEDFDKNGKKDILALTHNFGFTKSDVQIHLQKQKLRFSPPEKEFPFHCPPDSFVIWASAGDINGDSYPDLVFSLKFKDAAKSTEEISHRLFINRDGKYFEDISDQLPLQKVKLVGIHFLPANEEKRQPLFALDYQGNYYIAKMKSHGN